MANAYATGRFIIDTAGSTLLRATLAPLLNPSVRVRAIRWVGATTAGHQAIIQDVDSQVLWEDICQAANIPRESLALRLLFTDFKVTTLGSGVVYVYLEDVP